MTNIDELNDLTHSAHDPQFEDEQLKEQIAMNEAIDEVISSIEIVMNELDAVKQNFTTRRFNMIRFELETLRDELEGMKTDE
jgi:translation elongation factor EF-1alpha